MILSKKYDSCDLIKCYQYSLKLVINESDIKSILDNITYGNSFINNGAECGGKAISDEKIIINSFARNKTLLIEDLKDRVSKSMLTNRISIISDYGLSGEYYDFTCWLGELKELNDYLIVPQAGRDCMLSTKVSINESYAGATIVLLSNDSRMYQELREICDDVNSSYKRIALPMTPFGYSVIHSDYLKKNKGYQAVINQSVFNGYDYGAEVIINGPLNDLRDAVFDLIVYSHESGIFNEARLIKGDKNSNTNESISFLELF